MTREFIPDKMNEQNEKPFKLLSAPSGNEKKTPRCNNNNKKIHVVYFMNIIVERFVSHAQ